MIRLYFSLKQEFTLTSIIKAHLTSKLFLTVSETMKANTQLSSGYEKLTGSSRFTPLV